MKIPVGFRRKTGGDPTAVLAGLEILGDDVADEMRGK
jgi:hypothetical protein